jgi:hypothetical protein
MALLMRHMRLWQTLTSEYTCTSTNIMGITSLAIALFGAESESLRLFWDSHLPPVSQFGA